MKNEIDRLDQAARRLIDKVTKGRKGNVASFEAAQQARAEVERERELAPFRERFGGYDDWSYDDIRYLLDELSEGFYQSDDVSFVSVAGIGMARDGLMGYEPGLPASVLNDIWLASDALINLHAEHLDEQNRKAVETIWDLTCHTARPEHGFCRSHPFTGEVFQLKPQGLSS